MDEENIKPDLEQVVEELRAELKEAKKAARKTEREVQRLTRDNEILSLLNEKASHLREVIEREQAKRVFYNEMLLQNSPDIFLLVDEQLNSLIATASFYLKSPYNREQVENGVFLDDLFLKFLDTEHRTFMVDKTREVIATRQGYHYEERMLEDEEERIYDVTIRPAITTKGEVFGAVLVYVDITELVNAKDNAEAADKAKSNFLANMSHEIRTPMNAINGMSEFIIRDTTDPEAKQNALQIKSAASSLLGIINDILDFSKIEAGKMEIINVPYQPSSLFVDVATMINIRLQDKPVTLIVNADENLPCSLVGDEIRIKQVMINILNNAVKFTHDGTITLTVKYENLVPETEGDKPKVRIFFSVADTGIGIKKEDLGKLFSSFSQVDTKRNRAVEGTGLGLAISRRLTNAMQGEIKVDSVYGEGTTFSWSIVNEVDDATPMGKLNRQAALASVKSFRNTFIAPDAKILVVDDNAVNLKVATGILRPYHCNVSTASSGAEAIALTDHESFDVIFMDHMMPVMDGVEAMQRIRKNPARADAVIIALTANAISGVREKYKAAGFQDFLAKPIETKDMDAMLARFLRPELMQENTDEETEAEDPGMDDEILGQVWRDGVKKLKLLPELVAAEDWANYTIEVHALKSVSASIKEMELSEMAKRHEQAGKEKDAAFITEHFPQLQAKYTELVERLGEKYAQAESQPEEDLQDALSDSEWSDAVASLLEAFDDFDLDRVTEELNALKTHKMDENLLVIVNAALTAADDFDYDSVEENLKKLA